MYSVVEQYFKYFITDKEAHYHVLHVRSRWEDLRSHTVVVVQQSHHIPGGNVALPPAMRRITAAAAVPPAQFNPKISHNERRELCGVGQSHSCSGARHRPQDGSQDQVTAAHTHGTAVERASWIKSCHCEGMGWFIYLFIYFIFLKSKLHVENKHSSKWCIAVDYMDVMTQIWRCKPINIIRNILACMRFIQNEFSNSDIEWI